MKNRGSMPKNPKMSYLMPNPFDEYNIRFMKLKNKN